MADRIVLARATETGESTDLRAPSYQPKQYYNFREKLRVDPMRLGEEIMELSSLLMDVGEHVAVVIAMRDIASNELKEETSRAASYIRSTEKAPSESKIASLLSSHRSVMNANIRLEEAKRNVALWSALMDSARAKQSSLKVVYPLLLYTITEGRR
jgi:hypothetical protein